MSWLCWMVGWLGRGSSAFGDYEKKKKRRYVLFKAATRPERRPRRGDVDWLVPSYRCVSWLFGFVLW